MRGEPQKFFGEDVVVRKMGRGITQMDADLVGKICVHLRNSASSYFRHLVDQYSFLEKRTVFPSEILDGVDCFSSLFMLPLYL